MTISIARRTLVTGLALSIPAALLARTAALAQDTVTNDSSSVAAHPISHASLWLDWNGTAIVVDPVGGAEAFAAAGTPGLILVTHIHGDHFDAETLAAIPGDAPIVAPPTVAEQMPEDLAARTTVLSNGQSAELAGVTIDAIPAYNTTDDRLQYHPQGRDNGYVLTDGNVRVYVAGDTEDIPEMRALESIDLAFVPMNLPYTMDVEQAASGVAAFGPRVVYPYHYQGSDTQRFAELVGEQNGDVEVRLIDWYANA